MEIRLAKLDDREVIFQLIKVAQNYMKESGIPQWQNGYPTIDTVEEDIKSKQNYVLECNENIVGTCMISFDKDPNYDVIDGKWLSNKPYAVIHRMAIDPNEKGKGLANHFFKFAITQSLQKGVNYIRIDTHELNKSMRRCIEKAGFVECGIIQVQDKTLRIAYEREINRE